MTNSSILAAAAVLAAVTAASVHTVAGSSAPSSAQGGGYRSTLVSGRTPDPIEWNGRRWRAYVRSDDVPGLDYPLRLTKHRARFELRPEDFTGTGRVNRAELGGSFPAYPRLPNGRVLWGAMSFIHHPWAASMKPTSGCVMLQIHMGSKAGGSPAFALRRGTDGHIKITTNAEKPDGSPTGSETRYDAPLSFGQKHDLVYRIVLGGYGRPGALKAWIDGKQVVNLSGTSLIGHRNAEHYANVGAYCAGGVTTPIVAEVGNFVYPSEADLSGRIARPPVWPAD